MECFRFLQGVSLACVSILVAASPAFSQDCLPLHVGNPEGNYIVPGVQGEIVYRRVDGAELALDDLRAALVFVRGQAAEFRIDPQRVACSSAASTTCTRRSWWSGVGSGSRIPLDFRPPAAAASAGPRTIGAAIGPLRQEPRTRAPRR